MAEALRALQQRFAAALKSSGDENLLGDLEGDLAGDATRNRARLAIYRGNVIANRHGALALAFPVIKQLVGDEFFDGLARAYRHAQPSRSGNLDQLGAGFADFLAGFAPAQALPYLAAVAELEWALTQALAEADHRPLSLACLAELSPAALAEHGLRLQSALWLRQSAWPLASIWQQHQPSHTGEIGVDLAHGEAVMVYRHGLRAEVLALSAGDYALWSALQAGHTLGRAFAAALQAQHPFDLAAALQRGFELGLVIAMVADDGARDGQ